jgi:hypothetical protein
MPGRSEPRMDTNYTNDTAIPLAATDGIAQGHPHPAPLPEGEGVRRGLDSETPGEIFARKQEVWNKWEQQLLLWLLSLFIQ